MACPCGSGLALGECCGPIVAGERPAATAEALMRARYTAYTRVATDFLRESLHPDHRDEHDAEGVRSWAAESEWHGLEILAVRNGGPEDDSGEVEFACEFTHEGERRRHHERASFARHDGRWHFVAGEMIKARPYVRDEPKLGRNEPCLCGSGRKYKKCCGSA